MVVISIYYALCNADMRGDIAVHWQSHDALAIDAICYTCYQSISLKAEGDDPKSLLRAAGGNGRDVVLLIVENRSQLHSLIKVSQWLITIEFYIRWPTGPLPAQISLSVVVFPPTSKRISGQQFADFHQWKSVPTFLVYQGPSTKSNNRVLRLIVDPTLFTSSDII